MAITRTPIIDDDGTGKTGTAIDNAWKQQFYDQIDALVPSTAWAAYVPVWGALGTAPVLGNGTISASFTTVNSLTHVEIYLSMGSTTTYGAAANWTFTTPSGQVANGSGYFFLLTGRAYHAATGAVVAIAGAVPVGGAQFVFYCGTGAIGASVPFTWAAGDVLQLSGTYRSA